MIELFKPAMGFLASGIPAYYMLKAHRNWLGLISALLLAVKDYLNVSYGYPFMISIVVLQFLTQMSLCHAMRMASRHLKRPVNDGRQLMSVLCRINQLNDQIWSRANQSFIFWYGACCIHLIMSLVLGTESILIRALYTYCLVACGIIINIPLHLSQSILNEVSHSLNYSETIK